MKILAVVPLYPPHHLGGYEVVCQSAVERLAQKGHEIVVLTSETRLPGVEDSAVPSNLEVRRLLKGWWDWSTHDALRPTIWQRLRIEQHNQRMVRQVLDEVRPDVVSIWSLVYMSYSLATQVEKRSIPIVLTFGDNWICYGHEFDAWTRVFDRRPALRPLGRIFGLETGLPAFSGATASVASRMIYESIEANGRWKFPDAPVIPMGLENRLFPIVEAPARPWTWKLLYMGRVVKAKGIVTLIRAMAELPPQATLEVDGHVAEEFQVELTELARSLGVAERIRFSRSSRPDLVQRYRQADVVVFPSEWPEPFGLVPLEAMACGTPVVATGTGGSGEFLADRGNCLLFPPGDATELARAVRLMAEDADLRAQIIGGGTETASEMNMDRYAEKIERLHHQAVTSSA